MVRNVAADRQDAAAYCSVGRNKVARTAGEFVHVRMARASLPGNSGERTRSDLRHTGDT